MERDRINGMIVVDKPAGITSQGVVAKLRGILCQKKVGHTGTLDPMATGVLVICAGNATRAAGQVTNSVKRYHARVKIGIQTDTLDTEGNVTETADKEDIDRITPEEVQEAAVSFRGKQNQIPPMYSALKVNGRRLYSYAREGKEIPRKPREIEIFHISAENINISERTFELDVTCSSGTYIRSLIDDIGRKLEVPCTMSGLRRTYAGGFDIAEAVTLEELQRYADRVREELGESEARGETDRTCMDEKCPSDNAKEGTEKSEAAGADKAEKTGTGKSEKTETTEKTDKTDKADKASKIQVQKSCYRYLIEKALERSGILKNVDTLFKDYPEYTVTDFQESLLMNGGTIVPEKIPENIVTDEKLVRMYDSQGNFQALYRYDNQVLKPFRMFLQ